MTRMQARVRCASVVLAALLSCTGPASALTIEHGVVIFDEADVLAGNVTPGDSPGFPATISVPGSYRLASNLTVPASVNGIEVNAAEVTIDLAGFRMTGNFTALNGIRGSQRALTVRNGTIRAFGTGIRMEAKALLIEDMRISSNNNDGVNVIGAGSGEAVIRSSTITRNNNGAICTSGCLITGNTLAHNSTNGVALTAGGSSVIGNNISFNIGDGILIPSSNAGVGNNALIENAFNAINGTVIPIDPNACGPQAC